MIIHEKFEFWSVGSDGAPLVFYLSMKSFRLQGISDLLPSMA